MTPDPPSCADGPSQRLRWPPSPHEQRALPSAACGCTGAPIGGSSTREAGAEPSARLDTRPSGGPGLTDFFDPAVIDRVARELLHDGLVDLHAETFKHAAAAKLLRSWPAAAPPQLAQGLMQLRLLLIGQAPGSARNAGSASQVP